MATFVQRDIEGLYVWASMLIKRGAYDLTDIQAQINFFGANNDAAYLVIDLYTSEHTATEYCFLAAEEADEDIVTRLIFDFLREFDFSLGKLLAWLKTSTFVDTEMGEQFVYKGLAIWRKYSRATGT